MKKDQFNKLLKSINDLIVECQKTVFTSEDEINNTPYKIVRNRVQHSDILKSKMDKVVQSELYHVVGMSNLTASQMSTFISKIRSLLYYRPFIQYTANIPTGYTSLSKKKEYKCTVLDIPLKKTLNK